MATVAQPADEGIKPFNAYAAYQQAREENRVLWDALSRSIDLQLMLANRAENAGLDVSHHRAFIANIRSRVLS